jgi:heat shock protein HtpX
MLGNWFKTGLLMAAIMALFGMVGALLGGGQGMLLALALGFGINLWAYWFSDTMVLKLYRAQEVDATTAPQLYNTVGELAARAGLPMPKVYLIDEAQPNAFATGRNPEHAAVAATTGILQLLSARELRAVLAHELSHVRHRDILTSTITASIAGAISTLANFGMFFGGRSDDNRNPLVALIVLILAPIAAVLIQLAISRGREYEADRGGAELSGDPCALADALAKIDRYAKGLPLETAEAHPATAHMMIINPLSGGGLASLFRTHPPTEERIHRLLAMAG